MKLCKDCKHFQGVAGVLSYFSDDDRATCTRTAGTRISLVTGETVKIEPRHCWYARGHEDFCGKEGKWFDAIRPEQSA